MPNLLAVPAEPWLWSCDYRGGFCFFMGENQIVLKERGDLCLVRPQSILIRVMEEWNEPRTDSHRFAERLFSVRENGVGGGSGSCREQCSIARCVPRREAGRHSYPTCLNRTDAAFFQPNTDGVKLHPLVVPFPGEPTFVKAFPNSFQGTALQEYLRQRQLSDLTIAGMMTQRCVDSTVRAAFDLGFNVELVHDACATTSLRFNEIVVPARLVQAAFMASLNVGFAKLIDTDEACVRLAASVSNPERCSKVDRRLGR